MPPSPLFAMKAHLAAVVLLAALLAPSASAQFIYVANAGEDTVSKIDINSNTEVARYATWFTAPPVDHIVHPSLNDKAHQGPAPSRIARDWKGNVYVLNRFFSTGTWGGSLNAPHLPVLVKIAPNGGTPTSNGPTALAITNTNGDYDIQTAEIADKLIQWAMPVGGAGDTTALGRSLAIDTSGYLWVGMYSTKLYYKVDANTGNTINATGLPVGTGSHMPYGGQVDKNGKLWSVDESNTLAEIDTNTNQLVAVLDHSNFGPNHINYGQNYSLSVFNGCGDAPVKVYLSNRSGKTYMVYDPQTSLFSAAPSTIPQFTSYAIGVDSQGNIISGEAKDTGRVIKTTPGGLVLWNTATLGSTQPTRDLHGIIIDDNDDVWVVSRYDAGGSNVGNVIKYSGLTGLHVKTLQVGVEPYSYGNTPPPTCPCAVTSEPQIKCEGKDKDGKWLYSWSFVVTNNSPFSMPATGIDIVAPTGSPITGLKPNPFKFAPPLPPKGQATVSGTFTLGQPIAGSQVCFDIRLNFGEVGWCCPTEHICFVLPDCACASLQGVFKCSHGHPYLELSVTNLGPTAAAGAQIFSNTPGVTVSPPTTTQSFPQNAPVIVPLTVTGATPGQLISLSVMLHGPIDPKTGVNKWCCTATVKVTYPAKLCWWWPDGDIFDDINANGLRDSGEGGLPDWTVTLTDAKGTPRTTKSDASGKYNFEEVEPGKYRLSVQPPKGWRATTPKGGVNALSVEAPPKEKLDFGFVKTR